MTLLILVQFDGNRCNISYDGWESDFDEWIAFDNSGLRPVEKPTPEKQKKKKQKKKKQKTKEGEPRRDGDMRAPVRQA